MNSKLKAVTLLVVFLIIGISVFTIITSKSSEKENNVMVLSDKVAIESAREAVGDSIYLPKQADALVNRNEEGKVTVTWPYISKEKPPRPGPDYYAKVVINEINGQVETILVGE